MSEDNKKAWSGESPVTVQSLHKDGENNLSSAPMHSEVIRQLEEERNELAATVESLRDALSPKVIDLIRCGIGGNYGGSSFDEAMDKFHAPLVKVLIATPQQHLRDVRAEAGRDAIKALIAEESTTLVVAHSGCRGTDAGDLIDVSAITVQDAERFTDEYAERVKAGVD